MARKKPDPQGSVFCISAMVCEYGVWCGVFSSKYDVSNEHGVKGIPDWSIEIIFLYRAL